MLTERIKNMKTNKIKFRGIEVEINEDDIEDYIVRWVR